MDSLSFSPSLVRGERASRLSTQGKLQGSELEKRGQGSQRSGEAEIPANTGQIAGNSTPAPTPAPKPSMRPRGLRPFLSSKPQLPQSSPQSWFLGLVPGQQGPTPQCWERNRWPLHSVFTQRRLGCWEHGEVDCGFSAAAGGGREARDELEQIRALGS